VQMTVAFAVRHPAVTSTIIGPPTMEHLDGYLAADGIELPDDVLDRIDEIVHRGHHQRGRQHVECRHDGTQCGIPPPVDAPPGQSRITRSRASLVASVLR
jgi:hypothetical protein